ncbi:MAG: response regulator [Candidatus Lambdaproteobacteria bacterium]|nr:response regulator [Candidatus Lambdaproteobacteria bacterium]
MAQESLHDRLIRTFLAELEERVRAFSAELLALEKEGGTEARAKLVASLFRGAHSLKGAARSVGLAPLENLCHQVESVLAAVRDRQLDATRELMDTLFAALDAIQDAGRRLRSRESLADGAFAEMLPRLATLLGRAASQSGGPSPDVPQPSRARPQPLPTPPPEPTASGGAAQTGEPTRPTETALDGRVPVPAPESTTSGAAPPGAASTRVEAGTYVRVRADKLDALMAYESDLFALGELMRVWPGLVAELHDVVRQARRRHPPSRAAAPGGADRFLDAEAARRPGGEQPGDAGAAALHRLDEGLEGLGRSIRTGGARVARAVDALAKDLLDIRTVPFAEACEGFPRLVRDLAGEQRKRVELTIEGAAIELDRAIVQGLKDPLVHLVRNAIEHAIEAPDARLAAGRPEVGQIVVGAELRGNQVSVSVSDDGCGLDLGAIRGQALAKGLPASEEPAELAQLIFLPGFSTTTALTAVSGRGIGLDVVKTRVEGLHGTVSVAPRSDGGTRFELRLPLTLLAVPGLVVQAGGTPLVLLDPGIRRAVWVEPASFVPMGGHDTVPYMGTRVTAVSLAATLGLQPATGAPPAGKVPVVVVAAGEHQVGFVVDAIDAVRSIVVKRMDERFGRLPLISGATELPDGRLALVLNIGALIDRALSRPDRERLREARAPQAQRRFRLLLAEDSLTTRTLVKTLLEAAGYEVLAVADGDAAWRVLQEQEVDLIVSDIEMPVATGLELLQRVRTTPRFQRLPVVLVTALETEKDKQRGLELGANAYLPKSAFDQTRLISTIQEWL